MNNQNKSVVLLISTTRPDLVSKYVEALNQKYYPENTQPEKGTIVIDSSTGEVLSGTLIEELGPCSGM